MPDQRVHPSPLRAGRQSKDCCLTVAELPRARWAATAPRTTATTAGRTRRAERPAGRTRRAVRSARRTRRRVRPTGRTRRRVRRSRRPRWRVGASGRARRRGRPRRTRRRGRVRARRRGRRRGRTRRARRRVVRAVARTRGRRIGATGAARSRSRRVGMRVGADRPRGRGRVLRSTPSHGRRVGRPRGGGRVRVDHHVVRHASARRIGVLPARLSRGDRCSRRLARFDATSGGRTAGVDVRAHRVRLDRCATGLRRRLDVAASGRDRRLHRRATGLRTTTRADVTRTRSFDARGPATTTVVGWHRGPATRGSTRIAVGAVARSPVIRRPTVGMVAVVPDATPIPTSPVVPNAPRVRDPGIVVVPAHDQRRGRAPVVRPHAPIRIPKDERAVDVVVPAPGPVDAWEGLDRLGVGVHVGDDHDLLAARHRLVADHLHRLLLEGIREVLVLHVDVGVGVVGRWRVTDLIGLLLIRARRRWGIDRRRRLLPGLGAPTQRNEREENAGDEKRSPLHHLPSVPRAPTRYNPDDPSALPEHPNPSTPPHRVDPPSRTLQIAK
jgi:hypothetical protein